MTIKRWAYEDLVEGETFPLSDVVVTADEIIEFAQQFDPQPMHVDREAGEKSILGGLAAPGMQVCAIKTRMLVDAFIHDSTCQGSLGFDFVNWKSPVLAGDTLRGECTIASKRPSRSRLNLGLVTMECKLSTERGTTVLESRCTAMFLRREYAA